MEAMGDLTGGLAHDFNNLLTAVIGNFELILKRNADPRIARLAENGLAAARRGAKLTAQLLAFSRRQKLDPVPLDVNALIRGITPLPLNRWAPPSRSTSASKTTCRPRWPTPISWSSPSLTFHQLARCNDGQRWTDHLDHVF